MMMKWFEEVWTPFEQPKKYDVFTHVVEKGDTLYGISRKYTISIDELKRLNNLKQQHHFHWAGAQYQKRKN